MIGSIEHPAAIQDIHGIPAVNRDSMAPHERCFGRDLRRICIMRYSCRSSPTICPRRRNGTTRPRILSCYLRIHVILFIYLNNYFFLELLLYCFIYYFLHYWHLRLSIYLIVVFTYIVFVWKMSLSKHLLCMCVC